MNTNEIALLDPFEVSTPDEAAELSALVRALELAEGFRLLLVRCNQLPHRERLMEEVRARLPKLKIQTLFFREAIPHLLDAIQPQLITPMPDALFVSGLEFSLPVSAEAHVAPLIANLNASRNSFAQLLLCPVVLWVPEYVLIAIAQGAPDFFSIRSSVYFFAAKPAEIAHLSQNLSAEEWWEVNSLSFADKRDRIAAIERLLADYKLLPDKQRDRRRELRLVVQLGTLFYTQGKYDEALTHYEHSLKMAEELGNRLGIAISLHQIGNLHYLRGEYDAALAHYEQSLKIEEELGEHSDVAASLHSIGMIHQIYKEYDAALARFTQSLKLREEAGNQAGVANSLHQMGRIYQERGEYEAALAQYQRSLKIKDAIHDRAGVANSLHQIGRIYQERGEYEAALAQYRQSLKLREELGDRLGASESRGQLGQLFTELGRYPEAFSYLLLALMTFTELQSPKARIAVNVLKTLRSQWGAQDFDTAWREARGEGVPEWLLQEEGVEA